MPDLTAEQIRWIRNLYSEYFPHDNLCYPIRVFRDYLRFAKVEQLVLPRHLQFFDKRNSSVPELEFDIPAMLGDLLFLRLINNSYLVDLQSKARREEFNVFGYLVRRDFGVSIRKEERRFHRFFISKAFKRIYRFKRIRTGGTLIPELFFKCLDDKANTSSFDNSRYIWNFSSILFHKPHNIREAYQRFAHAIYTLRLFGIWKGIKTRNNKTLKEHLYDHLKKNIPFCRKILSQSDNIFYDKKGNDPKLTWSERKKSKFRTSFDEMVNNVLETDVGEKGICLPTDTRALIMSIKGGSNKTCLTLWESKIGLPDFSDSERGTIREKFNEIIPYLSSVNLSQESRERFKRVIAPRAKGKARDEDSGLFFERLDAMNELLRDMDSRKFLCEPEIKKIFTPAFIKKLDDLLIRKPLSLNKLIDESDEDKGTIEDKIGSPEPDVSQGIVDEEMNIENKKTMEIVRICAEKQFPNNTVFVDKFVAFYDSFLPRRGKIPPSVWEEHLKGRDYSIKKMFKSYKNIDEIENVHLPELAVFRDKIRDILHIIDKTTRYYEDLYGLTGVDLLSHGDFIQNVPEILHIIERKIKEVETAKSTKLSGDDK
jgi:hypothetical protein